MSQKKKTHKQSNVKKEIGMQPNSTITTQQLCQKMKELISGGAEHPLTQHFGKGATELSTGVFNFFEIKDEKYVFALYAGYRKTLDCCCLTVSIADEKVLKKTAPDFAIDLNKAFFIEYDCEKLYMEKNSKCYHFNIPVNQAIFNDLDRAIAIILAFSASMTSKKFAIDAYMPLLHNRKQK